MTPTLLGSYIAAFSRCYPEKEISLRPAKHGGYWVIINGERGERAISTDEIRSSTKDFNRGYTTQAR